MPGDGLIEDFILRAFLHDVLLKKTIYTMKSTTKIFHCICLIIF